MSRFAAGLVLLACAIPATADSAWHTEADTAIYATAHASQLQTNSVLDPGNRLARLAEREIGGEARLNLKLQSDAFAVALRPILYARHDDIDCQGTDTHQGYLSQWRLRTALPANLAFSLGRELMNWGPAQFRSPSSPFYFDNGRSDPTRELSGVDAAKLAWTPDPASAYSLAWVRDSGHLATSNDPWRHTWLTRGEWHGDETSGGLVLVQSQARAPFLGGHAQWTASDAWMLYGEAASATRADALDSPADPARPFTLERESARHTVALAGATRTLENGQSLTVEYLRNGHGYTRAGEDAYFARASTNLAAAALALAYAPPLLGREYLHLIWQSNPLDSGDYWRAMWSRNLNDSGNQWAAYYDHPLGGRIEVYALAVVDSGGPRREFSALIRQSLTLGLRLALP